nr:hypothetical protein [Tanacetum cinerariifolium]
MEVQNYLQHEQYALWEVIEFGDSYKAPPEETAQDKGLAGEVSSSTKKKGRTLAITAEDMQKRKNDVKARTTLLLALPDKHQLRFSKYDSAKELLQAIISHLEFMDVPIEQDDLNQKFLISLAPEWLMYTIVWRNKDDLDTMSLDDVYNHLKVYEPEMGHFAREFRSPKIQDRGKRESYKKDHKVEEPAPKVMIATDGIRWDWNYMAEEVEASKNHDLKADEEEALGNQKLDKDMKGVGFNDYCDVPPPPTQVYSPLKKDLSWMGLPGFIDDSVTDYTSPTPSIDVSKSISKEQEERWKSNHPFFFEQGGSSGNVVPKPMIKFVKESGCPYATKVNNTENARKPTMKYVQILKIPTVGSKVPTAKPAVAADKGNKRKAVKASAHWIWKPKQTSSSQGLNFNGVSCIPQDNIDDKGYWDSSCFRHMTGNISYLSEYEPFNRGYVSFGYRRGKIIGKGSIKIDEIILWHRRLGHLNFKTMNKLVMSNLVKGLPSKSFENDHSCVACLKEKQHKASCKFDAKGDKGYFVGYSLSSKVFKVFNKITKKIEENLHVDFLENKSIKKGNGPDWLFDIDTLTNSINYVPVVVAGTYSTNNSGTQEDVHQALKEKESPLRFIALPNWFHEEQMATSNEAAKKDDAIPDNNSLQKEQQEVNGDKEVPESSQNLNPTTSTKVSTNDSFEFASNSTVETEVPTVSSHVPTDSLFVPPAMLCRSRTGWKIFFRDISNAVSLNEVEADLSNMETAIQVSPTPTLRIHKDHLKSQIIEEPKKIVDALKDPSWVEAMQQELLQFKIQNVWPLGFQDLEFPHRVYKVEKAMYGLHQAPRAWYGTLSKYLLDNGFQRDIRAAKTTMDRVNPWGKDETGKDVELHLYRSMIRSLMYLIVSRPDIMFVVRACARHQVTPKEYSDYGGANQDKKSTTGGCQFLGRRLISWQCKKQTIVATFTTEVEYVAAASGCRQNGVAERRNRTLNEAARTILADAKLPITFWAEAVNTACYVQNK